VPLVIRLIGTNQKEGREILEKAGLAAAEKMTDAVQKVLAGEQWLTTSEALEFLG